MYKRQVAVRLHQLYQRRVDSLLLLSMIFQLDEEHLRTQSRKMFLLEEQYRIGCRSPFLYLAACRLAAEDGSVFRKMNGFIIQVYLFAEKYGILTEEMAFRAIDLAGQMKDVYKRQVRDRAWTLPMWFLISKPRDFLRKRIKLLKLAL